METLISVQAKLKIITCYLDYAAHKRNPPIRTGNRMSRMTLHSIYCSFLFIFLISYILLFSSLSFNIIYIYISFLLIFQLFCSIFFSIMLFILLISPFNILDFLLNIIIFSIFPSFFYPSVPLTFLFVFYYHTNFLLFLLYFISYLLICLILL